MSNTNNVPTPPEVAHWIQHTFRQRMRDPEVAVKATMMLKVGLEKGDEPMLALSIAIVDTVMDIAGLDVGPHGFMGIMPGNN